MKHIFIINPTSGEKKGTEYAKCFEKYCRNNNIDFEIRYTKGPKDATAIVKSIKEQSIIYSVGGDGTLSEIVQGIYGTKHYLGVFPSGTGNDFYRSLKEKEDGYFESSVFECNGRRVINVMSVGIDADINDNAFALKNNKKIPRSQIYNVALIKTFLNFKNRELEIEVDGKKHYANTTILAICNGKYYGGGFKVSPDSDLEDDYLNVILAQNLGRLGVLKILPKFTKGKHLDHPDVSTYRAKKVIIKSEYPLNAQVDGEHMLSTVYKIKILPKKIKIYNNKKFVETIFEMYKEGR